jgi:large subunit ribosomal protein L31e
MAKKERRAKDVVTREYTINLHKKLHSIKFKARAPRAVKEIKKFASKIMGTNDVRLDVKLNKAVWSKGIRNVPTRLRIVIERKRNDDEDAKVRRLERFQLCLGLLAHYLIQDCMQFARSHMPQLTYSFVCLQEEMYSFVTVAEDQTTKGKGPVVVNEA